MQVNPKTLYINREGPAPTYLMAQRTADAKVAPNAWTPIGGTAGEGEATEAAVHRLSTERVGLTGHKLTCAHEWVQPGLTTTSLRSLWVGETSATVHDLSVTMQAANFYPLGQLLRMNMTDTTRVALYMALPELIRPPDQTPIRAVLIDSTIAGTDAGQLTAELQSQGYLTSIVTDPTGPTEPGQGATGSEYTVDPDILLAGRPNPDIYRAVAKTLGANLAGCLVVSHNRLALVAASAVGAATALLQDPQIPDPNPQIHTDTNPWPVINNLGGLTEVLSNNRPA